MIGFADILAIIRAIFQFPTVMLEFVKMIRKTPEDKHEDILKAIRAESEKFSDTGRPTW